MSASELASLVGFDEINANRTSCESRDNGAKRTRGATITTDYLADVIRMHANFQRCATTVVLLRNDDILWIVDDTFNEVF